MSDSTGRKAVSGGSGDERTTYEVGSAELGYERLVIFCKTKTKRGASEQSLRFYAQVLGTVRRLAGKPLLDLTEAEVERLSVDLKKLSSSYRRVLKTFYRANKRLDVREAVGNTSEEPEEISEGEVMTVSDELKILNAAGNWRDAAIVAVLSATGGRRTETSILQMKQVLKIPRDGYQVEFTKTKSGRNRYSPPIEAEFARALKKWLDSPRCPKDPDGWLFPSMTDPTRHLSGNTIYQIVRRLAEKAGVGKLVDGKWVGKVARPHGYRHARATRAMMDSEDSAKISKAMWGGRGVSSQLGRYDHFSGRIRGDGTEPEPVVLKDRPDVPVPPMAATQARVADLEAELAKIAADQEKWREVFMAQLKGDVDRFLRKMEKGDGTKTA